MKVLTIGNGFVADHLPYEKINERLYLDDSFVRFILDHFKPDVLINCIGKTGRPNVDWCETHKEETASANVAIPVMLAQECQKKSIRLIQIGSGCIYFGESPNYHYVQNDGSPMPERILNGQAGSWAQSIKILHPLQKIENGWREEDFANPKSFYSKTKYACDLALGGMNLVTTLRIRMPVSVQNNPRNLINKLRGYKQIIDIPNSMTFMKDLTKCIQWAIDKDQTGVFHVVNPEPLTAVQIMKEFQKYVPKHQFEIISEEQLDNLTTAKRSNCILNTDKLSAAGFQMTHSEQALKECMSDYMKNFKWSDNV
jgi:dTDP-4-dehydrorhamnose reductase